MLDREHEAKSAATRPASLLPLQQRLLGARLDSRQAGGSGGEAAEGWARYRGTLLVLAVCA